MDGSSSHGGVGNPDIKPEKHHQLELGGQLNGSRWQADAAIYVNRVSDFILQDRNASRNQIYRNIDATLMGGEVNLNYRWSANWASNLGLAYVYAQNNTDDRAIAQTPPLEGSISLEYTKGALDIGAKVRAAAKQDRVDLDSSSGVSGDGLDTDKTPGWAVLDLYAAYEMDNGLNLQAGIDNALDEAYAQHLNNQDILGTATQVNEPGRTAWIKAKFLF